MLDEEADESTVTRDIGVVAPESTVTRAIGVVTAETAVETAVPAAAAVVEPVSVISDSKILVLLTSVPFVVEDALSVGAIEFVGLIVGDDCVPFKSNCAVTRGRAANGSSLFICVMPLMDVYVRFANVACSSNCQMNCEVFCINESSVCSGRAALVSVKQSSAVGVTAQALRMNYRFVCSTLGSHPHFSHRPILNRAGCSRCQCYRRCTNK